MELQADKLFNGLMSKLGLSELVQVAINEINCYESDFYNSIRVFSPQRMPLGEQIRTNQLVTLTVSWVQYDYLLTKTNRATKEQLYEMLSPRLDIVNAELDLLRSPDVQEASIETFAFAACISIMMRQEICLLKDEDPAVEALHATQLRDAIANYSAHIVQIYNQITARRPDSFTDISHSLSADGASSRVQWQDVATGKHYIRATKLQDGGIWDNGTPTELLFKARVDKVNYVAGEMYRLTSVMMKVVLSAQQTWQALLFQ